jgi:hypothetical protein
VKRLAPRPSSIRKAGRFEDGSEGTDDDAMPRDGNKDDLFSIDTHLPYPEDHLDTRP